MKPTYKLRLDNSFAMKHMSNTLVLIEQLTLFFEERQHQRYYKEHHNYSHNYQPQSLKHLEEFVQLGDSFQI